MIETLLSQLIAFQTVSETSNLELQQWLAEQLAGRGAVVEIVEGPEGRANLIARFGPDRPGGILLSGHTDVVPVGDGWTSDPWTLTKRDDVLYGRGTADMKGFFAALLAGLDRLDMTALSAPVTVIASYDEEIGCVGVRDLLPILSGDENIDPSLVIIGEPTEMRPAYSHPGKKIYSVEVKATEAHSSRSADYVSSISAAASLVTTLDTIQAQCPVPEPGEAPDYSINVGTIVGGSQANMIAGQCDLVYEIRHASDRDPNQILAPVAETLTELRAQLDQMGEGVTQAEVSGYPAMRTDTGDPAYQMAERVADSGRSIQVGFGTEGGLLSTCLEAPIMICGPGSIEVAHQDDEHVSLEQLNRCAQFVAGVVGNECLG